MVSLRDIRSRLRSISNIQQIMRAMQLVSGSKFKRSQTRLIERRLMVDFLDGLIGRLLAEEPQPDHALCRHNDEGESALVVFTSDTGLCGSYNTNLVQLAESHLRRESLKKTQVIYIGKRGHRTLTKLGYRAEEAHLNLAGRPDSAKSQEIGRSLIERFESGRMSSIKLLFASFISPMVNRPTVMQWLPIDLESQAKESPERLQYILEPSSKRVFDDLLPRWALAKFQLIMLEAFTSEHGARMVAMQNATNNADELIDKLTQHRNKARQASITKELSEIVGAVEALK